ncbi:hypothetical protein P3X46_024485 [Hevea brasiliensis]|uniref:TF-B3 domain-containing protein n=1 Tax=Hevea brasiliensis TaxID=3981 RepID=A0ABQ9L2P2_HEVBR|nr:hypothetical protein P3X46_024485 [Hevea brasiliensis]
MKAFSSKVLTQTDIERRFSVPSDALQYFPFVEGDDSQVDLKIKDTEGHLWSFRCKCRKGPYPKPVLSKGWLEFVHGKRLRVGDKVHLYKKEDEVAGVQFRIAVKRKILRLMGEDIWVDVEHLHLYGV